MVSCVQYEMNEVRRCSVSVSIRQAGHDMIRIVVKLFRRWIAGKLQHSVQVPDGEFVYVLPFKPGQSFRVSQGYGGNYSHTGESYFSIDFAMSEGTPVCAARAGVVYHVTDHFSEGGTHPSYKPKGNAVRVLHSDDTIACYLHLDHRGARVRPGDFVVAGEVIGVAGNTGWSQGPHLHFHVADAISRERVSTWFDTVEWGIKSLDAGGVYTRPAADRYGDVRMIHTSEVSRPDETDQERDPAAYYPELLELCQDLTSELTAAGHEALSDYCSVETLHDVHGIEVCGIRSPEVALDIVRVLLRRFRGWNARWFGPEEGSAEQGWVARVQRDRDTVPEYWDIE